MAHDYRSACSGDIEAYLVLRHSLGYSTELYARHLRNFDAFCAEGFPEQDVLGKAMVMTWIEIREDECVGSQRIRASIIRKLGEFQASEGKPSYILPKGILASPQRFVPYILSDGELSRLFVSIDTLPPHCCSPDRQYVLPVVSRMMLCCGLRPGEPLRLLRKDVDLKSAMIAIKDTKRHKSRLVVLSKDMAELCKSYDEHAGKREFFFEHPKGGRYQTRWFEHQLAKCLERSGLADLPVRPYDFRHRFATTVLMRWTDEGLDVQSLLPHLAEYMGHTEIRDTLYYVHLLADRISISPGIDWAGFSDLYPKMPL
jgi:integrase